MEKVAFLNLTYNSFTQNSVWKKFLQSGSQDEFNLYIHPKHKTPSVFSDFYIEAHLPTQWGHFSLVEATIELMKSALEDEENEYFTLISDSHFPLYNLQDTVDSIKKNYKKMTFMKHLSFHTKDKSRLVLRDGVKNNRFKEYNAVCQFFVCRRSDAQRFVDTFSEFSQYFHKDRVVLADEFYFWAVANDLGMDFDIGQGTCFSDWSVRLDGDGKQERNPRSFKILNDNLVDHYRRQGYLFVRKITAETLNSSNPLKKCKIQ